MRESVTRRLAEMVAVGELMKRLRRLLHANAAINYWIDPNFPAPEIPERPGGRVHSGPE